MVQVQNVIFAPKVNLINIARKKYYGFRNLPSVWYSGALKPYSALTGKYIK
jgi:hypothetical protein